MNFKSLINKPVLILDKKKCITNIEKMIDRAKRLNIRLRPHFKTHQSFEIGRWFRERGISGITVSSLEMAHQFSKDNWNDILVAFPVNLREIKLINYLAERIDLKLTAESINSINKLGNSLRFPVSLMVKIDCGYHRTGISADDREYLEKIVEEIGNYDKLKLNGFLTHAGHSYKAAGPDEIIKIHKESKEIFLKAVNSFKKDNPGLLLSYGDTPTSVLADNFKGLDEIRPGNFVFFDLKQWSMGVCAIDEISVILAAPVAAKNLKRREVVIYGGAVHLSKDSIIGKNGKKIFGIPVLINNSGWEIADKDSFVSSLSQEHGIVKCSQGLFSKIEVGDIIGILPVHSCLTANMFHSYMRASGEKISRIEDLY